ncbi:MAG TPA: VIT and VWA domain-containing protein [Verrucomicrobiae bacterium]|jgi:Ca-activated chloride channel family protein|nr:VIT and VWA domain-containing protein [Verrucomicrobiae bacterium]
MKQPLKLMVVLCWLVPMLVATTWGDAGVLIPRDKNQPDPAVLSLEEMEITIRIDNSDARIFVKQIFANHTGRIEEGNYVFALGSHAVVSDFATWDGPVRIPAVILERKRAEEIYNQLKQQSIDPGLLEMGERTADEARRTSIFSAKITPIPAYGTKRLEFEYHESIPVDSFKSYFGVPLRPEAYHSQVARHLIIHFELRSEHPMRDFKLASKVYPLKIAQQTANSVSGSFEGTNVSLTEDFGVQYELDQTAGDTLHVLAFRNPDSGQPNPTEMSPVRGTNEPGFLEVEALIASRKAASGQATNRPPHNVVVLFDNSLSMQWDKLERTYGAMQQVLHSLTPQDHFNLLLFNSKVAAFQPAMAGVTPASVQQATDFVRASRLRGGTDLQHALETGLEDCAQTSGNNYLVLLTDGSATRGVIQSGKLAAWYAEKWKAVPDTKRPKLFVLAVGDDANLPLLRMLTHTDGVLESVLSTEPAEFKLNSFVSKMNLNPIGQLGMDVSPQSALDLVYPLQDTSFAGSMASWVGQYKSAQSNVGFNVRGVREGEPFAIRATANLPQKALEHDQLPRLWAKARVDALLEKIERDGEDQASIDEIIRLARKYKFVTPYTSFLAVPRALLRPRVIRPGDPVLRVRTDPAIVSVVALFPFGLTKPLRYLGKEDIWQTRFLAPVDMEDGTHSVRLILRDRNGNVYREAKTFIIASKPPTLKIVLDKKQFRRGDDIHLRINASASTRTLFAQLEGAAPVSLRWNPDATASTGTVTVAAELLPGRYRLTVTAEDVAHNIGAQEVQIEVLP